jgi:hypothetical protein
MSKRNSVDCRKRLTTGERRHSSTLCAAIVHVSNFRRRSDNFEQARPYEIPFCNDIR